MFTKHFVHFVQPHACSIPAVYTPYRAPLLLQHRIPYSRNISYYYILSRLRFQVVMSQGGSIEYFQTAVFNFPTLAEAYNVAAEDGLRKVDHFGP